MIQTARTPEERQKLTTSRPFSSVIVIDSVRRLRPGTVLIKSAVEIPQLAFPERRIAGWRLVDGVDAYQLDRWLRKKGWHLFFFASAIVATGVALTYDAALQTAVRKAFRKVERQGFNALEISGIESRNYLGMKYTRLIVHARQVQRSPYARDLDHHSRVERVWDFKRVQRAMKRKAKQVKAF